MTSEQIKNSADDARTVTGWLREIAYQLAVANESREPFEPLPPLPSSTPKRVKR